MSAPELKPCPFCGGEADIEHDHTAEKNHAYGCRDCDLWFDTFNSDDAITAWNTRATDTRLAAAEAMAEALREIAAITGDIDLFFEKYPNANSDLYLPMSGDDARWILANRVSEILAAWEATR